MIMQANTSRSLSWAGCLAVTGLGILLLPLTAVQGQALPPRESKVAPQKDPRDEQIEALKKAIQVLEGLKEKERATEVWGKLREKQNVATEKDAKADKQAAESKRFLGERLNQLKKEGKVEEAEQLYKKGFLSEVEFQRWTAETARQKAAEALKKAGDNVDETVRKRVAEALMKAKTDSSQAGDIAAKKIAELEKRLAGQADELKKQIELKVSQADNWKWAADKDRYAAEVARAQAQAALAEQKEKVAQGYKRAATSDSTRKAEMEVAEIASAIEQTRQKLAALEQKFAASKLNLQKLKAVEAEKDARFDEWKAKASSTPANKRAGEGDIDKKIDQLMKEVEELRRELRQEKLKTKPTAPKSSSNNNPFSNERTGTLFRPATANTAPPADFTTPKANTPSNRFDKPKQPDSNATPKTADPFAPTKGLAN